MAVKYALAVSQLFCFVSLVALFRKYRISMVYLLFAIPATLAFRAESGWLHSWYTPLVAPVAVLRLAAAIEIAHRQTEGFLYWSRLTGTAFLIAFLFALESWVQSPHPTSLQTFVELRRLSQVWLGAFFVVVEGFWLSQGGGLYRKSDQIAACFGVLCLNHAVVSVLGSVGIFTEDRWPVGAGISAGIDAGCYVAIALISRRASNGRSRQLTLS